MNLQDKIDLYFLISEGSKNISLRTESMEIREKFIKKASNGFVKTAFDTRRIDQESEFLPRKALRNYHRSEQFISEGMSNKIEAFVKLSKVLEGLKNDFGKEPEWQDSYARILISSVNKGLRTEQKDGDFSEVQPSVASLDYLEELMHVRYRLTIDDLMKMGEADIKKTILSKDEHLIYKNLMGNEIIKQNNIQPVYNDLLEKLFGGIKASKENPEIVRTVTITIKESLPDKRGE